MSGETDFSNGSEWELSKENVLPRKGGRKVANLSAALGQSTGDYQSKIHREKQLFEVEIRTYEGDDPLDVWYRYIVWVCENFPTGGRDQAILLERCIALFKDEEKYKNDERYLKIWMQYADLCTDPIDVYNYMHSQGVCSDMARFYESWAYILERLGNNKKADEVYNLGINRNAKPVELLKRQHRAFESRLVESLTNNDSEMNHNQENGPQRTSLGGLKSHGKKGMVGGKRTGNATLGSKKCGIGGGKVMGNSMAAGFTIFQDGGPANASSIPAAAGEWQVPPTQPIKVKENTQKPGKWNEAKLPQRYQSSVPFDGTGSKQGFTVHVDENIISNPPCTPKHGHVVMDKVLSSRKPDKHPTNELLKSISKMDNPEDQTFKVMYCKDKIYAGAAEFSFEELRAARMFARLAGKDWASLYPGVEQQPYKNSRVMYPKDAVYPLDAAECQLEEVLARQHAARLQARREAVRSVAMTTAQANTSVEMVSLDEQDEEMEIASSRKAGREGSENYQLMAGFTGQDISDNLNGADRHARRGLVFRDSMPQAAPMERQTLVPYHDPPSVAPHPSSAFHPVQNGPTRHALGDRHMVPPAASAPSSSSSNRICEQPSVPGHVTNSAPISKPFTNVQEFQHQAMSAFQQPHGTNHGVNTGTNGLAMQGSHGLFHGAASGTPNHIIGALRGAHTPEANRSLDASHLMSGPSPTVTINTKAAMDEVMAMFTNPLMSGGATVDEPMPWNSNNSIVNTAPTEDGFEAAFSNENALPSEGSVFGGSAPAFAIFDETQPKAPTPPVADAENQENRPPKDYFQVPSKRPLTGVLQPSVGIPVCPLTEEEEDDDDDDAMGDMENHPPAEYPQLYGSTRESFPTDMARESNPTDVTTYSSFSAAARVASTPFHSGSIDPPSFSVSTIQPPKEEPQGDDDAYSTNDNFACTPSKMLSPIFEQSDEDYRSSSSSASSTASSGRGSVSHHAATGAVSQLACIAEEQQNLSRSTRDHSTSRHDTSVFSHEPQVSRQDRSISRHEHYSSRQDPSISREEHLVSRQDQPNFSQEHYVSRQDASISRQEHYVSRQDPSNSRQEHQISRHEPSIPSHEPSVSTQEGRTLDASILPFGEDETTDLNPFSDEVVEMFLSRLRPPVSSYDGYCDYTSDELPKIAAKLAVSLGDDLYRVEELIGKGAFAKVYRACKLSADLSDYDFDDNEDIVTLKVQPSSIDFEFYICRELHNRMDTMGLPRHMHKAFMNPAKLYTYDSGSVLVDPEYHELGSLLGVVNKYKVKGAHMEEATALIYAINLLRMLHVMHRCDVIHGDIKPDNILILESDSEDGVELRLVDFGRSIDMRLFPRGTAFTANCYTDSFQCIEMKTNRPWTTQVDTYGLLGVLHCLLHGEYMKVFRHPKTNRWKPTKSFARHMNVALWNKLFDALLNIPSNRELPSLADLLGEFEEYYHRSRSTGGFTLQRKKHDIVMSS